ncbi:MAG TPA: hypothetical protein VNX65_04830 [Patescibacteria group bacterium]|jgi:hypothetical protein|nr:hypothetical protein [Patescibacteria group bacterium]
MQVEDLYVIIRELRRVAILQAGLKDAVKSDPLLHDIFLQVDQANSQLKELLKLYEQYSI